MARPFDALLFDLDGTLVDSARDLQDALNAVLVEQGLRRVSLAETRGMIGDGVLRLLERGLAATGGDKGRASDLLPRFLAAYEPAACRHTRPYAGVPETLQRLRGSGMHMAVVTNKLEAASLAILEGLRLAPLMDAVVGGDTVPQKKPDPAPLREALRRLGVEPSRAVMVGDNHHDVAAARAAGLAAVVVVGYGYAAVPAGALGADLVIEDFTELPSALATLACPTDRSGLTPPSGRNIEAGRGRS